MTSTTASTTAQTVEAIRAAITEAIPGADVDVTGNGDHFEIRVVSTAFDGKSKVAGQRLVYGAIKHLMSGPTAPVHAIDRLETVVPETETETEAETEAETESEAEGGHRVINLTPEAQDQVRRLIELEGRPGVGLRLAIKGGGCSGLSYDMAFTERREGDTVVAFEGFEVFLDRKSVIYLSGVTLAYQGGLSGRGFVFHNPQATNTCGCGESFSL